MQAKQFLGLESELILCCFGRIRAADGVVPFLWNRLSMNRNKRETSLTPSIILHLLPRQQQLALLLLQNPTV
jgi:hypothetical protein